MYMNSNFFLQISATVRGSQGSDCKFNSNSFSENSLKVRSYKTDLDLLYRLLKNLAYKKSPKKTDFHTVLGL